HLSKAVDHWDKGSLEPELHLSCLSNLIECARRYQSFSRYESYVRLYERKARQYGDRTEQVKASLMNVEALARHGRIQEASGRFMDLLAEYQEPALVNEIKRRYARHLADRVGKPQEALGILHELTQNSSGEFWEDCRLDLAKVQLKIGKLLDAKSILTSV